MAEAVKVIVRCRPMNSRERELNCQEIIGIDTKRRFCGIREPSDSKNLKDFTFDGSYDKNSTTEQIYADVGFALVESVCEGYNGTIFAYGQTGCGKSFSMQGIKDPATQRGIIPRAFEHIFEALQTAQNRKYLVRASYLEIYNEEVRDLLGKDSKQKLEMREHPSKGVYVVNLGDHKCNNTQECERLMERGWNNRATGATLMNADSSRSHSIFSIIVEMSQSDDKGEEHIRAGKLNLVDLAGSERQDKTGATGDRLKEATKINLSLSALGNVISALVDGKAKHIPYRDSKLTRLLQDSLGGNTKTLMVACLSPASDNYEESLSTLRYANRAKNIKNKPKINEDPKDALLREFQEEIKRLKAMLEGRPTPPEGYSSDRDSSAGSSGELRIVEKTVYIENAEALEEERQRMKAEYEEQVRSMKELYEQERISKEELRGDLERMRSFFDSKMTKLDGGLDIVSPGQTIINDVFPSEGLDSLKMPDHVGDSVRMRKGAAAKALIDESEGSPRYANGEEKPPNSKKSVIIEQGEALKRLQELQKVMIGGEKVNDEELKKKRNMKKKYATSRMEELAEALASNEDDTIMLKVYDDIQEELRHTRKLVEKEREKRKRTERELEDMQHEFERDRNDYLSSIRDLEQQNKLLNQILSQVQPVIPRDCNYYNLDRVKSTSKWDDEKLEWKMPPLFREQVHLPPTGPLNSMPQKGLKGMVQRSQVPSSPPYDPDEEYREDMYLKKLEQKQQQNPADYFQSKRANKLLSGRPQADEPPPGRYQQNGWVTSPTGQWPEEDYGKKSAKPNPLAPTKQSRKW